MSDDPLLREQIEYYRRRAPEYDDWFYQRGRYDEGDLRRREWRAEHARADAVLRSLGPRDAVLELAPAPGSGASACCRRRAGSPSWMPRLRRWSWRCGGCATIHG